MTTDNQRHRIPSLLVNASVYAFALAGLWLATWVVVPSALYFMELYGTQVPSYCRLGIDCYRPFADAIYPLGFAGAILLVLSLVQQKLPRVSSFSAPTLKVLATVIACITIYLLASAGVAYKLANTDQLREIRFYKRALDEFSLLESAQGRFEKLNDSFKRNRDLKLMTVKSASQFNNEEARERVNSLIASLPKITDVPAKKRLLATLALFRDRIPRDSISARDISQYAVEVGAPPTQSHAETLEWIAANLNNDGWEPIPLFKFGR